MQKKRDDDDYCEGMRVTQIDTHTKDDGHEHGSENGLRVFIIACICAALAYAIGIIVPRRAEWAFAIGALIAVLPFARSAFGKALKGQPFSIETLVTIAVVGALPIGAGAEAVVVVALFSLGELLEGFAAARARSGLTALAQLLPSEATIEEDGKRRTISVTSLTVNMVMFVTPGERLAADGIILEGRSDLNEAAITGESTSVDKSVGAAVFAGSINGDGQLKVTVSKDASNSVVARIGNLVAQAQASCAPTARFIDSFSAYYTPAAILLAALIAVVPPLLMGGDWSTWIYRALTVLLIACPCALVLSTPAAIATGIATAARYGILVKSGAALEMLAKIKVAAFDKTGTLTLGHPVVTDVEGDSTEVLRLAAAVETGLSHPVARGIVAEAVEKNITIPSASDVTIRQGEGVEGIIDGMKIALLSPRASGSPTPEIAARIDALEREGKTIAVLFADTKFIGIIGSRDESRADAKPAIAALTALGIKGLDYA
jgi:Cd2+/Zn2+-exporting ATPase